MTRPYFLSPIMQNGVHFAAAGSLSARAHPNTAMRGEDSARHAAGSGGEKNTKALIWYDQCCDSRNSSLALRFQSRLRLSTRE